MTIRFKKFLEKLSTPFATTKDSDLPGKSKLVCVSRPEDIYKRTGKTHGVSSHAIKHLIEFEPGFVKNLLDKLKNILYNQDNIIIKRFGDDKEKVFWSGSGKDASDKLTDNVILNTLDYINDKIKTKQKLVNWEKEALEYIKAITDKYGDVIENMINKSVDIDKDPKANIVKFKGKASDGHIINLYYDKKTNGLIIVDEGAIRTLFTVKKSKLGKYTSAEVIDKIG